MTHKYDLIIIGAGILGLAVAYQLLKTHLQLNIALLDKEDSIAQHQTGHNSGVNHLIMWCVRT